MKTRQEIRDELESFNPITNVNGVVYTPGDAIYEELMERWIDAKISESLIIPPPAEMWQVKVWMVRNGIDLASIPGIMAASIPAGPQLQEALVRWETAPLVPFDNALVGLIAGALNISKELAWSEIRAI